MYRLIESLTRGNKSSGKAKLTKGLPVLVINEYPNTWSSNRSLDNARSKSVDIIPYLTDSNPSGLARNDFSEVTKKSIVVVPLYPFALPVVVTSMEGSDSIKSSCSTYTSEENEVLQMRNLLGGILGAVLGASLISYLIAPNPRVYPDPFGLLGFLLDGSRILEITFEIFLTNGQVLEIIVTWLVIGIILFPFSKTASNTIRTSLWLGVVLATFSIASILLTDAGFWSSPERNVALLMLYVRLIISSLLPLLSAVPLVWIGKRIRKESETVAPAKIETTCECGAVFKSKPMICALCGRTLIQSSSLSADSSS